MGHTAFVSSGARTHRMVVEKAIDVLPVSDVASKADDSLAQALGGSTQPSRSVSSASCARPLGLFGRSGRREPCARSSYSPAWRECSCALPSPSTSMSCTGKRQTSATEVEAARIIAPHHVVGRRVEIGVDRVPLALRRAVLPPAQSGVVVVGAGIDDRVGYITVGQIVVRTLGR